MSWVELIDLHKWVDQLPNSSSSSSSKRQTLPAFSNNNSGVGQISPKDKDGFIDDYDEVYSMKTEDEDDVEDMDKEEEMADRKRLAAMAKRMMQLMNILVS